MGLTAFLSGLRADGRVQVASGMPTWEDMPQAERLLGEIELEQRDSLPAAPPEYTSEGGLYGLLVLYRACQLLVYRDEEVEVIERDLRAASGLANTPSVHYSVDLALQHLPALVRLARMTSRDDPLVTELIGLAGRWPLSAVGIDGAEVGDETAIISDDCLLQLYVDRIMTRRDLIRLKHERVREAVQQAIGAFPELAPQCAAFLGITASNED